MYQPISYKVIRQALSWSILPDPISVRMVNQFKWPNGTVSGEYIVCFEGWGVRDAFDLAELYEGSAADSWAKQEITDSFCSDVTPVRTWVDAQHDKYYVELYGRVTTSDGLLQEPLFDLSDEDLWNS